MDSFLKTIIPIAALHITAFHYVSQHPQTTKSENLSTKPVACKEIDTTNPTNTHIETPTQNQHELYPNLTPYLNFYFEPLHPLQTYSLQRSRPKIDPPPQWTLPNLRSFLSEKNLMYPNIDSAEFDLALTTRFYPPTESLKLGFGVCDEFALLALYGLLQIPGMQQTYLGMVSDEHPIGHAFTLYELNNYWGFTSNDEVSQPIFPTPQTALENMLTEYPFDPITSYFFIRKVDTLGPWVYDINAAEHLSPDKSIAINTLDNIMETNKEF